MAPGEMGVFIQQLRRAVAPREAGGQTDGQLLEDYVARRDEAALAALVRRHAAMVWGTVRRVLNDHHDAEDAFQATFLVLVRKAASLRPREMVANWLHGVARQTALKARATAARRKGRERQVATLPEPAAADRALGCELHHLLDEELSRLPEKYRVLIVLCDLEGMTRKEAAGQLGCPEGTVAGRLARARAMLAKRLARHGLAVSGGAVAPALVPPTAISSTLQAASLFAAGQTAVPVKVAALAEGALKAMSIPGLKAAAAGLLLLVAALGGGAGLTYRAQAAREPEAPRVEKAEKEKRPAAPQHARKQRLLRWRIVFDTKDGREYAKQLEALGARLAIPTGKKDRHRLICDLSKRPVKGAVEDVSKIDRIFLVETNSKVLRSLAKELGLKEAPGHIVVFLPKFVEDELLRKELDYEGRAEKDIAETTFRFSRTKRGYEIKVTAQR